MFNEYSVRLSSKTPQRRMIGVIGAGIIGMGCAYRLQTELPNSLVTVVAADFSPSLTSDGAPGVHELYNCYGTDPDRAREWSMDCYQHLRRIALSSDSLQAGVGFLKFIKFSKEKMEELPKSCVHLENFKKLTLEQIQSVDPSAKDGYSYTTVTCEPRIYLPWLYKRFINAGGRLVRAKVTDLSKFCNGYDLVVNCTGLGAAQLVNDSTMLPIKGTLIRVTGVNVLNCAIDASADLAIFESAKLTYVVPGRDAVTLGGSFEIGESSTHVDPEERKRIIDSCTKWNPRLKGAKVVWEWCGLRPYREGGVRLEIDRSYHHTTNVIHNYGHAGVGVTLHWGCAGEVLNLARQCFEDNSVVRSKL